MTKEETDIIITEQNRSRDEILKAVAKVKADYHELCKLKDMRIAKLEKENAELKKESDFYHREKGEYKSAFLQEVRKTIKLNKQLTKTKELLRMVIDSYNHKERFSFEKDLMKAEQFLKENDTYERIQKAKYNYTN